MRASLFVLVAILISMLVTSCVTTSTYGATFKPIEGEDLYTLKIYYGGPPPQYAENIDFQEGTNSKLYKLGSEYIVEHPEFKTYKVVKVDHSFIPSYYKYTIKFIR
jgi:hypothetical protein